MKKTAVGLGVLAGFVFLFFSGCDLDDISSGYDQLNAEVAHLKFFESGRDLVPYGDREYDTIFDQQTARFISYELGLRHDAPGRQVSFTIEVLYYSPDNSVMNRRDHTITVEPDWRGTVFASGYGSNEPGSWQEGEHRVEIYEKGSGNLLVSESFVISSESDPLPPPPSDRFTITLSASPAAGGTVSGGGTYSIGDDVTVTAAPNPEYRFKNWTEGGSVVSTSTTYTFTVDKNRTLVANFEQRTEPVDVAWVHIDTIYRVNAAGSSDDYVSHGQIDYHEEAYDIGGFVHLKNNSYEQNMAVDRYEDRPYGRGPYSHTEDRHVRFTWDDPPSVVSSGDSFNVRVDVEVFSESYERERPTTSWPTVQVIRTTPADIGYTYAFSGLHTQMIEPIKVDRNNVRLTRLEYNPFGILKDDWNYPPAYYLDSSGYAVYKCHTRERGADREGDLEYFELRFRHAKVHYVYELQVLQTPVDPDPQYIISVSAIPSDGGRVSGGGSFDAETEITVIASPNPGYRFKNWTEGGQAVSTSSSYTFTVDRNRDLAANFEAHGEQGGVFLDPRHQDGTVSGVFMGEGTTGTEFSVSPEGVAVFDYENGQISVVLTSELSVAREIEVQWKDIVLDGKGYLSAHEQLALEDLFSSDMGESLALIALEAGCLSEDEIDSEQLAALLAPFQLALKYLYPDRRERVLELAEKSSCNYFDAQFNQVNGSWLLFSPSGLFPYIFGFFPFDEYGAAEDVRRSAVSHSVRWQSAYDGLLAYSPSFRAMRSILDDPNTRIDEYGAYGDCLSKCRGACGPNCPQTCESYVETVCLTDDDGENTGYKVEYDIYECGVHPGCIAHDDCYDDAIDRYGCNSWLALAKMHNVDWIADRTVPFGRILGVMPYELRSCDSKAIYDYDEARAVSWALGYGPYSDTWVFAYSREYDDPNNPGEFDPDTCPPALDPPVLMIIPDEILDGRVDKEYIFELMADNIPEEVLYVYFQYDFGDMQSHARDRTRAVAVTGGSVEASLAYTYRDGRFYFGTPEATITVIMMDNIEQVELARATAYISFSSVTIQGDRNITHTLPDDGRTDFTHDFEAVASPEDTYTFVWNFGDGSPDVTDTPVRGQSSRVSHTYTGLKDGDIFRPRVELRSQAGDVLATDSITINVEADDPGEPVDPGDFETVTIGNQVWMKRNLNIATGNSWCYDDDPANCGIYGRLYDWETAMSACPPGWRLPSDEDWTVLTDYLGGEQVAGGKMKSTCSLWLDPNTGATNESGWSGLPGGIRHNNVFFNLGSHGHWWGASEGSADRAWSRAVNAGSGNVYRRSDGKGDGLSVRCLRE